jgi:hypothetical protein
VGLRPVSLRPCRAASRAAVACSRAAGDRGSLLGLDHGQRGLQASQPPARAGQLAGGGRVHARQRGLIDRRGLIGVARCGQQLGHLTPNPGGVAVAVKRRVGRHLGAIQRDHRQIDQARRRAQPQPRHKQAGKRPLLIDHEPRDRRVIGDQPATDHPKRRVGPARRLDLPTRPHPAAVRVQHQRAQHLRVIRRAAGRTTRAAMQRTRVQLADHIDHKPRQMPLIDPLAHAHRQKEQLLAPRTHIRARRARPAIASPAADLIAAATDRLPMRHHADGLLTQAPAAPNSRKSPAQEATLPHQPDEPTARQPTHRSHTENQAQTEHAGFCDSL